jgi:hypothetical protein
MEDHQARFLLDNENSYMVLKMMLKITKFMGIGNLQRVIIYNIIKDWGCGEQPKCIYFLGFNQE